uniref:Uncharacterized protein n=1 Tax=Peronospora matthiolae TaxID=2874970 RepID=A0AAV1VIR2_9STRA
MPPVKTCCGCLYVGALELILQGDDEGFCGLSRLATQSDAGLLLNAVPE